MQTTMNNYQGYLPSCNLSVPISYHDTTSNKQAICSDPNTTHFNGFPSDGSFLNNNCYPEEATIQQKNFTTEPSTQQFWRSFAQYGNEAVVDLSALRPRWQTEQQTVVPQTSAQVRIPKRFRTTFSPSQVSRLEREFQCSHYVVGVRRSRLAEELKVDEKQVKIWFQNRRMKVKRERRSIERKIMAHNSTAYSKQAALSNPTQNYALYT